MTMLRLICLALLLATAGAPQAGDPVPPPPISGVLDVSAGTASNCLLTALGTVRCWGRNSLEGQLGIGVGSPPDSLSEPQPITAAGEFLRVSAGNIHSCALRSDGVVLCWGGNYDNQLGGATMADSSPTPLEVPGLGTVTDVAAGDFHSCAVIDDGTVRCWGFGSLGQLGNGTDSSAVPLQVTGINNAVQVEVAGNFSCARLATGAVSCWGQNSFGQLGRAPVDEFNDFSATPLEVAGLGGAASDLALGNTHACALVAGVVRCWGNNGQNRLGDGGGPSRHTPGDVIDIVGASPAPLTAVALGAGGAHTCAVRPSGALVCWGSGSEGRLGNGGTADAANPVAVQGLDGSSLAASAVAVDGGGNHTCARTGTGEARCWGLNANRQLGDGTTTQSATPVIVRASQEAMSLVASASSLPVGSALTLTATVNLQPFSLDDLPGADVTFYDGRTPITGCVELALGGDPPAAQCSTSALAPGLHEVSAHYSGGAFSSPTLAGPLRIEVTEIQPSVSVHSFDFSGPVAVFGAPLTSIPEDTRPFDPWLALSFPITTHLLRVADMPFAFADLQFSVAHDNPALFDGDSFQLLNGEFDGEAYKAVAITTRPDANGSATLTYSVRGPANQLLATATQPITVGPVNDPPAMILSVEQDSFPTYSMVFLPEGAANGSLHEFIANFQLYGTPADETGQALATQVIRNSGSSTSPITGNPVLLDSRRPDTEQLSVDYRVTATGAEGWVRYDLRLQDDGGGFCLNSGEGPNEITLFFAQHIDILSWLLGINDAPSAPTAIQRAIALTRPAAVRGLTPDLLHTSVLPNACSRRSRVYIAAGEWAYVDVASEWRSQLFGQIGEVLGRPFTLGKSLPVAGEGYVLRFRNAGNRPLAGVRVRIPQPPGVSSMNWTCERSDGEDCATPTGSGAVDLLFDLDIEDAVYFGVEASFDGSQSFVTLRGEAIYPPGVQAIRDDTQSVQVVVASSAEGIMQNGFER